MRLLGETDIDAIIAERLSGQTPFTSTDFMWPSDPGGSEMAPMPVPPASPPAAPAPIVEAPPPEAAPRGPAKDAYAIDMSNLLSDVGYQQTPEPPAKPKAESQEVDLNDVLHDMRTGQAAAASPAGKPARKPAPAMESVLKGMRDEAANDASPETAEQHFKLAATYVDMGMQEEAMKALEVAARSPRHRFRAGAMLAKAYLDIGDPVHAIEWYERAVEAPAPVACGSSRAALRAGVGARGERRERAGAGRAARAAGRSRRVPRCLAPPRAAESANGQLMLKRLLLVAYFIEVGLLLVLVPWSPFWERNYFLTAFPVLQEFVRNNYVRGAVSGLGVVNLLMGFKELASVLLARRRMETMETIEQS